MTRCRGAVVTAVVAATLAVPAPARAQRTEPLLDSLTRTFKRDYLSVGALLQIVGDVQGERTAAGHNGFGVANARLRVSGRLDRGFSYALQLGFDRSPALLDARISYGLGRALTLDAGRFKAPFSREQLTSAASIDFVNRAAVVTAFAPGRQVGAQLRGHAAGGRVAFALGAANGGGTLAGNDDGNLLYTGRVAVWPFGGPAESTPDHRLEVGVNLGLSHDAAARVGGYAAPFRGHRTLVGADLRLQEGRLLLAGEYIATTLDSTGGANHAPTGWHSTIGWHLAPRTQVLARWDAIRHDGLGRDADLLVLGVNRWPTRATELQVNWIVDLDDTAAEHHQVLVNLQVGF